MIETYEPVPGIEVRYVHHGAFSGSPENRYSLGSPPEPESADILSIKVGGSDITAWLEGMDFSIEKLEEEILGKR